MANGTAYINGRVHTVNDASPSAEAFIVSDDGTFTDVGSNQSIQMQAKEHGLPIYDLKNAFVMPGIHDAHVHLLYAGYALLNDAAVDFELNPNEVLGKLHDGCCACAYTNVYQDWIVANGFIIHDFDRSLLDKDYPDTPVVIRAQAGHAMYVNTAALKQSGIDAESEPDQPPAIFVRRKDGSLTGELHETAMDKVTLAIPYPQLTHAKRSLKRAVEDLHAAGVTSLQEAASNTVMLEALRDLDREGSLKINIAAHIVHTPQYIGWESSNSLHKLLQNAPDYKTAHVDTGFLKVILDGVPLHPLYSHGDLKENGEVNMDKLTHKDIASVIEEFDQRGITCKVHCTGHGSTRAMLDAVEAARKKNPNGPRHEVAHCSGVHDDDYARYAKLNCTAEMSPSSLWRHPMTKVNTLMDWDFSKMIKHQAHVTVGSDWIGTSPPSMLDHCAAVLKDVDTATAGKGGEALCKMLTINGAQAVGLEKEHGSIEVGKKANFIVVSRDLSLGEFDGAEVLKTWFEGELVWEKST